MLLRRPFPTDIWVISLFFNVFAVLLLSKQLFEFRRAEPQSPPHPPTHPPTSVFLALQTKPGRHTKPRAVLQHCMCGFYQCTGWQIPCLAVTSFHVWPAPMAQSKSVRLMGSAVQLMPCCQEELCLSDVPLPILVFFIYFIYLKSASWKVWISGG